MSQNLLLDYNGGTPQEALTGHYQRPWHNLDSNTLSSITGALEQRPDYVENAIRQRLIAKQCIQQGIVEDRFTRAANMKQHKHPPELLMPGTEVDFWRKPNRKDEDGWRGPAELISVQRKAASGIIQHQGQPHIIPLRFLRKHVLLAYFVFMLQTRSSEAYYVQDSCSINPSLVQAVADVLVHEDYFNLQDSSQAKLVLQAMEIVDNESPGKFAWIGIRFQNDEFVYVPDLSAVEDNKVLQLMHQLFSKDFHTLHGVIYGTGLLRIPSVPRALWGLLLHWDRLNRSNYTCTLVRVNNSSVFN